MDFTNQHYSPKSGRTVYLKKNKKLKEFGE